MKKHTAIKLILSLMLSSLVFCGNSSAKIIYVDDDASGANDGSSWENSYHYLQDALSDAKISEKPVEIRVAQGTYTPDKGANVKTGNSYEFFELINGVTISGGFKGLGTQDTGLVAWASSQRIRGQDARDTNSDPNARDIELYQTILSGDLLNNDANDFDPNNLVTEPSFSDNSLNVVWGSFTDETSILDGFTITAGNARGDNLYYPNEFDSTSQGGGIYIEKGKPVIANCTFILNAAYEGGAIYNVFSDPNIHNCKFFKNSANYYLDSVFGGTGAALFNIASSPVLKDCEFIENFSSTKACIYNLNKSNAIFNNCLFSRNTANMEMGGGLLNIMSNPILTDCNFTENSAVIYGGAIANDNFAKPVLKKCIFTKNHSGNSGGAIYNVGYSEPNMTNCIFTENTAMSGGGFANDDSFAYFSKCTFEDNQGYYGGGFYNNVGNPIFVNCTFSNNRSGNRAGAGANFQGNPIFRNCIFSGNFALLSAGALWNTAGNLKLINCTFTGNYAQKSGNAVLNDSLPKIKGSIDLLNCIIWNGTKAIVNTGASEILISFSDLQGGISSIQGSINYLKWGLGNIDAEPLFVKDGLWADVNDPNIIVEPNDPNALWHEGDYHLKSAAGHYDPNSNKWLIDDVNSPCIDAGDPNSPFANEHLPNGGRIDMGAYGNTPQASKSPENPQIEQQALKESQVEAF